MSYGDHEEVYRDVMYLEPDGSESIVEVPVCRVCVPRHSSFSSYAEIPQWPYCKIRKEGEE